FTDAQIATTTTVPRTIRRDNGATRKARSARPARRHAAERRARRLRVRVLWSAPREIVASGMMGIPQYAPAAILRPLQLANAGMADALPNQPHDPYASVREPKRRGPAGLSTFASVTEPIDEKDIIATAGGQPGSSRRVVRSWQR